MVAVDLVPYTQFHGLDVLSEIQIRVELRQEQLLCRLAHEDVLKAFARFKAIHVIIVNVRLDANLEIAMKAITTDFVAKQNRPGRRNL
jgi:hypothetical protein